MEVISAAGSRYARFGLLLIGLVSIAFAAVAPGLARGPAGGDARKRALERRLAGPDGNVMVVAHRGCWKGTSENSLDAIRACIAAGVDMVELDVRTTRDGKLILLHDATVDRMTDGHGEVDQLDWAELRKRHLRAGRGGGTPLTDRRIPTFEEALRVAKDKILINVDAKVALPASVVSLIDTISDRRQILFKAEASPAAIEAQAPWVRDVRFQPILREPGIKADPASAIAAYDTLHPVSYEIDIRDRAFGPGLTPIIRARCARYWVNALAGRAFDDTVDAAPDAVWSGMIALGVDAIQTDAPIALKTYLNRIAPRSHRCAR